MDEAAAERRVNNERLYQMVQDIHHAVFQGNGTPPLVTLPSRLDALEKRHEKVSAKMDILYSRANPDAFPKERVAQWGGIVGIAILFIAERLGLKLPQ